MNPLETAINVAIPEFDGRIITVPISFKERQAGHDGALLRRLMRSGSRGSRVSPRDWCSFAKSRMPQKRIAFVLTNSSAKAAQVGNAVGLDAPASLLNLLRAMRGRGYRDRELCPQTATHHP